MACASFVLDTFIGTLPPKEGKLLYNSRVDPILTFSCEVVLDVDEKSVQKVMDVQHLFIRRLLDVGSRSMLATLFTETGIMPLRFHCTKLAIRYLAYLGQLPSSHYVYAALQESKSLLAAGFPCWIVDLNWVIAHLPGEGLHHVHVENMSPQNLLTLQDSLKRACDHFLQSFIDGSPKCVLLRRQLEMDGMVHVTRKLRHYLADPIIPTHRRAFTSIIFSTHSLAIVRLRYQEHHQAPVPCEWRLRFMLCWFVRVIQVW